MPTRNPGRTDNINDSNHESRFHRCAMLIPTSRGKRLLDNRQRTVVNTGRKPKRAIVVLLAGLTLASVGLVNAQQAKKIPHVGPADIPGINENTTDELLREYFSLMRNSSSEN